MCHVRINMKKKNTEAASSIHFASHSSYHSFISFVKQVMLTTHSHHNNFLSNFKVKDKIFYSWNKILLCIPVILVVWCTVVLKLNSCCFKSVFFSS